MKIYKQYLTLHENLVREKHNQLVAALPTLEKTIIGNSASAAYFNPEYAPEWFNLSFCCLDMELTFRLYEKYFTPEKAPNFKTIALSLQPYSLWQSMDNIGKPEIATLMILVNQLFGLGYQYRSQEIREAATKIENARRDGIIPDLGLDFGTKGYFPRYGKTYIHGTNFVVHNNLVSTSIYHTVLENLLDLAKERGHEVVYVLAPKRTDMRVQQGDTAAFCKVLTDIFEARKDTQDIKLVDFYVTDTLHNRVNDHDYEDPCHIHHETVSQRFVTETIARASL